jgi:hypothetical protein
MTNPQHPQSQGDEFGQANNPDYEICALCGNDESDHFYSTRQCFTFWNHPIDTPRPVFTRILKKLDAAREKKK